MEVALITGGSGHVGANLTRELINQGYKVRCIDFDNDHRAFENLDVELVKGDITEKESLETAFKNVDIALKSEHINTLKNDILSPDLYLEKLQSYRMPDHSIKWINMPLYDGKLYPVLNNVLIKRVCSKI